MHVTPLPGHERATILSLLTSSFKSKGFRREKHAPAGSSTTEVSELDGIQLLWDAGVTGESEIVGVGDTGLDVRSCFFFGESRPHIK